jgi:ATP-dependent protease ClpP protease subunit
MAIQKFNGPYIMNRSDELNFASSDYKIFIMDKFKQEKCAELIANLYSMIDSATAHPMLDTHYQTKSPYELPKNNPIALDVYLNSGGGDFDVLSQLSSLFGLAKSKGIIIRTYVPAYAGSCASMLAIQGTPGYRIMGENAQHLVHYGRTVNEVNLETEVDKAYQDMKNHANATQKLYLQYTTISEPK